MSEPTLPAPEAPVQGENLPETPGVPGTEGAPVPAENPLEQERQERERREQERREKEEADEAAKEAGEKYDGGDIPRTDAPGEFPEPAAEPGEGQ